MIKPPAMGVFARDPPPNVKSGASASSNVPNLQQTPVDPSSSNRVASASSTLPPDDSASDPLNPDDEPAQDDDDQGTVDEEAGVIRCICGCDDDDGFTIQCDRCLVWQHCACFGMSQASVPDEYLCEQCEPRPVDVAFAQAHQQKRKNNEARKALMDRNLKRQAQALASNNYTQNYSAQDAAPSPSSSTHPLPSSVATEDTLSANQQPAHLTSTTAATAAARSRKPSQALDLTNTQFVVPELPASAGSAQRGAKQRKGQKGSRRGFDTPSSVSTPVRGVFTPGSSHERTDDPFDLADQLEAWHVEFTPINKNVVADPPVLENLAIAMLDWEEGSPLKAVPGPAGRVIAPTASRLSNSSKLIHSETYPPSSSTSSPSSPSPRAPGSPIPEADLVGISAVGQECIPVELSGPSLADLACRTYVKHISESASAGVFSNLLYVNSSADEPQRGWCASRAFSRPVMHGLFADGSIPAGAFISEFRGELYSADAYRNNPINQYAALGATKPHVHLLPPPLNLAIDARRYGNEARFARFSCHPNAVLRPILFHPNGQPSARSRTSSRAQSPAAALALSSRHSRYADTPPAEVRSEEPQLVFGLFALTDIPRTHEITLGWEWDDAHIVHFLPELVQNPFLESRHHDLDANQHTANMVALAEKGEFPYAETEFSLKMSTVAAALLGCVLCACIGSAAPPGGGGGASANNGRKQDCAVAQMLRVGNGMSLLNVNMPGKANRRAKLPDFSPLVGIRRYWRPLSMPPTPETSVKDGASPVDPAVLAALAAEGDALDGMDVDDEVGCGGNEVNAKQGKRRKSRDAKQSRMQIDDDPNRSDVDKDDGDDTRSIASSLTDPLSGLSDNDTLSEEEDHDLMHALRAATNLQSRQRPGKGGDADAVDTELSGLFLLPPKKRSMRTRIKATLAPSDDEDAADEHADADEGESIPVKSSKSTLKAKASAKRKGKVDAGRAAVDFSSDEDQDEDGYASTTTPIKKRRKAGDVVDPSSPLSSVPSPNTDRSNPSPSTPGPRPSTKRRLDDEKRMSDVELSKKKRAVKRGRDRNGKATEPRTKESASKRRKREEARVHRNAILDLGDTESSQEDLSEEEGSETNSHRRGKEDDDETMADADSRASTPRASVKQSRNLGATGLPKKTKKEVLSSPTVAEDEKPNKEDTPTKSKKVRRILSDSEASSDEGDTAPATSRAEAHNQVPSADKKQDAAESNGAAAVDSKPAEAKLKIDTDAASLDAAAAAPAPTPAPAPQPEVKKEEPRVKLSLAEYKRRLAERRVSNQQVPTSSNRPLTPSLATPISEVTPSPSPAIERSNPLPLASVPSSEPSSTSAGAEAVSTPTSVVPPSVSSVPVVTDPSKASSAAAAAAAAAPRGVLFTSISAPTAIRSVEIPKSPSPEPQAPLGGMSGAAAAPSAEAANTTGSNEAGASSSSTVGPASSPVSTASALASAGTGADTPALLMRLETRRGRAPSMTQQPGLEDREQTSAAGNVPASDADGFAKPQSNSTANWATTSSSTPLRSPSLGPTRVQPGRMPPSPSSSATFNPPKAPRAFMSPPGGSAPTLAMAPASSIAGSASTSAAAPASTAATAPSAPSATATLSPVTSTPARIGIAGVAAGLGHTPSSASSASSTGSTRYPAPGLTSPTPATNALPGNAAGSYPPPRNYPGVPKGPASMRDGDPRADAWAEAREAREARDARGGGGADYYGAPPARHHEGSAGRDMGWGDRSREAGSGGWGRERRDPAYRDTQTQGYAREDGAYPYRRPSATEYDDTVDPYNRGIIVRGRSLGLGGNSAAPASVGSSGPPAAAGAGREYRDYDDPSGPSHGRGGFRSAWGGRSRPRGGRGRGGWMR